MYDEYYQEGGNYIIPVEVFNELLGELEEFYNKSPYAIILANGEYKIWPYPEVQDFTPYKISETSLIYLNDDELECIEFLISDMERRIKNLEKRKEMKD